MGACVRVLARDGFHAEQRFFEALWGSLRRHQFFKGCQAATILDFLYILREFFGIIFFWVLVQ